MAAISGAGSSVARSAIKRTTSDPKGFSFQQIMLRVKNEAAVRFWEERCGFTHLHKYKFDDMGFDLHFLASLDDGQKEEYQKASDAGESEKYVWTFPGTVLELTVNHGDHTYWPGNNKGPEGLEGDAQKEVAAKLEAEASSNSKDGFGHVAITVDSVEDWCKEAEEKWGLEFQKRPDEGRMKGLAFAKTPSDGYWIEVITRKGPIAGMEPQRPQLNQCMLRVKDAKKSIAFYERLGMTLLASRHFPKEKGDFSLFFMATLPEGTELPFDSDGGEEDWAAARTWMTDRNICVLELTHNHGTEDDESFKGYFCGNEDGRKGFGHVGFLTGDLEKDCEALSKDGVAFKKKPDEGKMRNIAFALDPDGYWVELIQRGMSVAK